MKALTNYLLLTAACLFSGSCLAAELDEATDTDRPIAHAYMITGSGQPGATEVEIINLSDDQLFVAGTLYNVKGRQLGDAQTQLTADGLPPRSRLSLTASDLETLFDTGPWRSPAMLEIEGSAQFQVLTRLVSPNGQVSNANCVTTDSVHNISGEGSGKATLIRLINTGSKPIDSITGTLYQADGSMIGIADQPLAESLPAKGTRLLTRGRLMDIFMASWTGDATLVITSSTDNLVLHSLNQRFSDGSFVNFSCTQKSIVAPSRTSCSSPRPEACIQVEDPVCAERDNLIRCVTEPCQSIEWQTYSNGCIACADPLVFSYYKGSCETLLAE